MNASNLSTENVNKFYKHVLNINKKKNNSKLRVPLDILVESFKIAFPGIYHDDVSNWRYLLELLQDLEAKKLVLLPKSSKFWNNSTKVSLPQWITLSANADRSKQDVPWRQYMWHPELNWLTDLSKMNSITFEKFKLLNTYLQNKKTTELAIPIKERSLQIFGDEKELDKFVRAYSKFCDVLQMTNSYITIEPLIGMDFQTSSKRILVIENRDTYTSFCTVNGNLKVPIYKSIYYGRGMSFLQSANSLVIQIHNINEIEYFGDLDPAGLYIPQQALKNVKEQNQSIEITLSKALYDKLIDLHQNSNNKYLNTTTTNHPYTLEFLDEDNKQYINDLFRKKERIPQELLNIQEIEKLLIKMSSYI